MDNNVIEITINGTTYYIPSDQLQYLQFIGGKLVNVGSSTINLVHTYDTQTTYPRITCSSQQACRYYANNQQNYSTVTSNYSYTGEYSINMLGQTGIMTLIAFILLILLGVKLIWKR